MYAIRSYYVEQQEPVEIREGDQPLVVIDTSGHYQSLDEIDAPVSYNFV